jgi:hypothetical protein
MKKDKKRHFVYLAGSISNDSRTYEWRERFTELTKGEPGLVVVDPSTNNFNTGLRGYKKGGKVFTAEQAKRSQTLLRAKDFQMIKICSLMVVNIGLVSDKKPLIGTIMELAWSRDIFYIPVIGITEGKSNVYVHHPWVDECISYKVETIEEAIEVIKEFFL